MKTKKMVGKLLGVLLLAFILFPFSASSQEIIRTEEGDTLITLTSKQVTTLNLVFSDLKWQKEKIRLQGERIELMETRIERADTLIQQYGFLVTDLENEIRTRELVHQNAIRKERLKWTLVGGGTGIILGVLITLICTR